MEKTIRQLAVFVENRAGRLAEVSSILGMNSINILGFSIADTAGYGIFRIIVEDVDRAKEVLRDANFTIKENEVLCVDVPHEPGGLAKVLKILSEANINVEYLYVVANTLIVFNLSDLVKGRQVMEQHNISLKKIKDISS